jgi:hypothetical protein
MTEAKGDKLGAEGGEVSHSGGAEAIPEGKHQLPSSERAPTDMAGSTQWEKRTESAVVRGAVVLQLSNQNEVASPAPTLTMVRLR